MGERRRVLIGLAAVTALLMGGAAAKAVDGAGLTLRSDQVDVLLNALKAAPTEGFGVTEFDVTALDAARTGDAAAQAKLKAQAIAYASAEHGLRIAKADFDESWGLKPAAYDAKKDFAFALSNDKLADWVQSLPPPFARYRQLKDGLVVYSRIADQKPWKPVPAGSDLAVGATGARVAALRARLVYEDGGLAKAAPDAPFDAALKDSVIRFQTRHGLNPTGLVSAGTLAALNITPAQRVRQISANMERWRWIPRDLAPSRIEVNVPAAALQVYDDNKPTLGMLAAAGKPVPDDHTPMLKGKITSIVLNPAWHIPASIAPEIYAKQRKDKGYFAREGITTQPGNKIAPLVQAAGPKSALGQVKFDFDNPFGVYLHDTPAQAAFGRSKRDVSHGCVRVEKPVDLAALLLTPNGDWPQSRIAEAIKGNETQRIGLKVGEPVYLLYFTAYGEGAQLAFRADPYGWDTKLMGLVDARGSGKG
ncbi:murein L,D-transpeptidase [soil metagenome]